jgi:hypothetical protein
MVSDLIKLYIENFDKFSKNEKVEIFKQIYLDEFGIPSDLFDYHTDDMYLFRDCDEIEIMCDYNVITYNTICVNIISKNKIYNKCLDINITQFIEDSNNIISIDGIFISHYLYDKMMNNINHCPPTKIKYI